MRGGTSKGPFFLADDLPRDPELRNRVLLAVMGSPDPRQIDGLGGAEPLTSKVAIISRSERPGVDVDFLFAQVVIDKPLVDVTPNCGNMLAGVAPFAIERGLVKATDPVTRVSIYMVNTGNRAVASVHTPGGVVRYDGSAQIAGVPGAASPIAVDFLDTAGSVCDSLLPTRHARDTVEGIEVTCIDNGMPVVVIPARALGKTGYENPAELDGDAAFKARLERVRLAAGRLMGLGDVTAKVVPKMTLIAPPQSGGHCAPEPSYRTAATRRSACSVRSASPPPARCRARWQRALRASQRARRSPCRSSIPAASSRSRSRSVATAMTSASAARVSCAPRALSCRERR